MFIKEEVGEEPKIKVEPQNEVPSKYFYSKSIYKFSYRNICFCILVFQCDFVLRKVEPKEEVRIKMEPRDLDDIEIKTEKYL